MSGGAPTFMLSALSAIRPMNRQASLNVLNLKSFLRSSLFDELPASAVVPCSPQQSLNCVRSRNVFSKVQGFAVAVVSRDRTAGSGTVCDGAV